MTLLYCMLIFMVVIALTILSIPFIKNHQLTKFVYSAIAVILLSTSLYGIFGSRQALQQWYAHGKEHYQLMEEYHQLGGVDGIIERIKMKLANHPNDAAGWFILGKLYLAKHDDENAKQAFIRAHELAPENQQIEQFYLQSK